MVTYRLSDGLLRRLFIRIRQCPFHHHGRTVPFTLQIDFGSYNIFFWAFVHFYSRLHFSDHDEITNGISRALLALYELDYYWTILHLFLITGDERKIFGRYRTVIFRQSSRS